MNRKGPNLSAIAIASTAIAIASGVLVLAGYFFAQKADGQVSLLTDIRLELLRWAIILAGVAVFIGIVNLGPGPLQEDPAKAKGISLQPAPDHLPGSHILVWPRSPLFPEWPQYFSTVFTAVQLPVEASLMALLAVTLTYASIRLLKRRFNLLSVIFLVTALLILLGTAPLPFLGMIPGLSDWVRPFITQVMAAAGARGILIGVALGTLTTGLRILFGADRPYGGNK